MKKNIYLIVAGLFLLIVQAKAQAPNAISYQGVARNVGGAVLPDQPIGLEFTIHQGSDSGTIVYEETQKATTNQFGLFTVSIGTGTVKSGTFSTIGWGANGEYLEVAMDPTGGINYIDMGTQQLLSVPYALYAASSGNSSLIGAGGSVLYGTGTGSTFSTVGNVGQVLESNGSNAPTWVTLSATSAGDWHLTGNAAAYSFSSTPATYLGTTAGNGAGFQFGVGGNNAGRVESGGNTAIGYLALDNSGKYSTAVGAYALYRNMAANNTAVGYVADYTNSTGDDNVAIGDSSLFSNTTSGSVAVGASALKTNTGADNVAVGENALQHNTTALGNTAVGYIALDANTTGANNTAVGYQSLVANTSGNGNTAIGYLSNVASGGLTNATAIGANAVVGESNALVLGGTGSNAVNVGINTTMPNSSLQISGGNISLPITVSSTSVNLSTSPLTCTVIITATGQTVTLPTASFCKGRVYIIIAQFTSGSVTISSFLNFGGTSTTSVSAQSSIIIQSDGANWDQIR